MTKSEFFFNGWVFEDEKTAKWELSLDHGFRTTPCSINPVSIAKQGTLLAGTGGTSRHGKTSSAQFVTPCT